MNVFRVTDALYSKDVEIDDKGRVVYLCDFAPGDIIEIPAHMLRLVLARACPTPPYSAKS